MKIDDTGLLERVEAVRRFNRFYTRQIGVLKEGLLDSPFTLTEARVIYELAHHERTTATHIAEELDLDAGYLSRILRRFRKLGLVEKSPSESDRRQSILSLTREGHEAFAKLNTASRNELAMMLEELTLGEQHRLVGAMHVVEEILGAQPEHRVPYLLRPHQSGDMGWVVQAHGALYAYEYGWNADFEALVADIVAKFLQRYDPGCERCWIAEKDGENVGSVFLVRKSKTVAILRLLLVHPKARGLGIGKRLVSECVRFAQRVGYRKITLWTNDVLHVARHIYEETGFRLVHEEAHHSFGHDLAGQTWELTLPAKEVP